METKIKGQVFSGSVRFTIKSDATQGVKCAHARTQGVPKVKKKTKSAN